MILISSVASTQKKKDPLPWLSCFLDQVSAVILPDLKADLKPVICGFFD